MADEHDTPNVARLHIPWFDDPSIKQGMWEATIEAARIAQSKGANSRDLMLFHLEAAAAHAGCEVWELHETLRKAGVASGEAPGEQ